MKKSIQEQQLRCIGMAASMYQIRKFNKLKKGAITMIDRLDKFPHQNDYVLVNDRRAFKVVKYVYTGKDTGFRRFELGPTDKVDFATTK